MLKEPPDQRKRKPTARQVRRGSALRRIEEYERFEVHCNNIKKLEKEKREKKCQDILTIHSNLAEPEDVDDMLYIRDTNSSVPIVEVEILWLVLKCKCKIAYRKLKQQNLEDRIQVWRKQETIDNILHLK